jgi:hypothetical protein
MSCRYQLKHRHIEVDYSTAGPMGATALIYKDRDETDTFRSTEVARTVTPLGTFVSVVFSKAAQERSSAFGFFEPDLSATGYETVEVTTVGVCLQQAPHESLVAIPALHTCMEMRGTATKTRIDPLEAVATS